MAEDIALNNITPKPVLFPPLIRGRGAVRRSHLAPPQPDTCTTDESRSALMMLRSAFRTMITKPVLSV